MNKKSGSIFILALLGFIGFSIPVLFAGDDHKSASADVMPGRYVFVSGDGDNFEAHEWMKTGYIGGIKDFNESYETPQGIVVDMHGRALFDEDPSITRNNYDGEILVEHKKYGFVRVEFKEFPKFYDTKGGVYHPFLSFSGTNLDRELEMDMGNFIVSAGLMVKNWPQIEFEYEREFKDGDKSRLTWGSAVESGMTRKIAPSWQEIHETVNVFTIKAEHEIQKYTVKGEQHWELIESENRRYEKNLGTIATQRFYNIQTQNPEANYMSSTASVERWYLREKAHSALNYRYARVKNSEQENLREYDENLNPMSFSSNAEQKFNARADNHLDSHTAVISLMGLPRSWLAINAKAKSELLRSRGSSIYPSDIGPAVPAFPTPPDGIIDHTIFSDNKNRTFRNGQSVSVRFKRIPRTALYTDFDIEETRNWLTENRWDVGQQTAPSANEVFGRRTITDMIRGTGAVGGNFTPIKYINSTAQFRYRYDNETFNDKRETSSPSTAKSAFFEEMDTRTVEFNTRTTLRVLAWLQPSFRYIVRDIDYFPRAEVEPTMEAGVLANDYILDATFTPFDYLIVTGSFGRENLATKTPANANTRFPLPGFDANVDTWLFSVSYIPKEYISFNSSIMYSRADNFNDYVSLGLPLGSDFGRLDFTFSCDWKVNKILTLRPEYSFFHYGTNPHADAGGYNAHLAGFEASVAWG